MKANVKLNAKAFKTLAKAQEYALKMTAEHMLAENKQDEVMPRDTGNLQNMRSYVDNTEIATGKVSIVTDAKYAARLYWHPEFHFRKHKNASAGGLWWEDWISGTKKGKPLKLFKGFYKSLTGGL